MAKMAAALALAMALYTLMAAAHVEAVDITGFTSTTVCDGNVLESFPNHGDGDCAPFALANAGSVLIEGLNACKEGIVYNVDCAEVVARRAGTATVGSVCFIGGNFTSGKWRTLPQCV